MNIFHFLSKSSLQAIRSLRGRSCLMMTVALAALSAPLLAQLPGLPAAPAGATVEPPPDNDNSDRAPTPAPAPVTVLRGSLFKSSLLSPAAMADDTPAYTPPISYTSVSAPKPKKFQKNDLVTIIVSEISSTESSSKATSQKQQSFDMAVQQFIQLATSASGVPSVGVVGQPSKLPEIKFQYDNNRQNQADQARQDTFTVRLSAQVVDLKPNGTMVIEAVRHIQVDKEIQEYKLSGVCRVQDVTGDNTILSTQLANLSLSKKTTGEVHDGTRSGWLNSLIDKFSPF